MKFGGETYTAENAAQLVLNEAYIQFDTLDQRAERISLQSQLANALFDNIQTRSVDLLGVIQALDTAAKGRHLMAWSPDADLEDLFTSFGASGAVTPVGTLVSFQNVAANKLDWFLEPSVDVAVRPAPADRSWVVTLPRHNRKPCPGTDVGLHRRQLPRPPERHASHAVERPPPTRRVRHRAGRPRGHRVRHRRTDPRDRHPLRDPTRRVAHRRGALPDPRP